MNEEKVTYFAETDARNRRVKFGIKAKDRTRHVYVIGKTGMGKSTLLENMAVQDIQNGEGMAFIDPHGKTADLLLEYIPEHRVKDVVYFAPFDLEYPISFNVLESVDADKRHLVVSGLMSTFKKIWQDAWSARMEYILTNTLLALLEYPDATLLGVNRMLSDKDFRKKVVASVTDPSVKSFWIDEFANYTERMAAEAVPAIQNKVGQFTANPLIRNMIGQARSSFNIREMMDQKKILIVNLSKGRIGESNANLLGGMLITKIYLAAMSRADTPDRVLKTLPNFYLFVDEFQNFANESFADILSEARKYKLNLTIAHQYIEQMEEEVASAVFGNVGTMIAFRVGATDAEYLEKEFAPQFTLEDIVNLGFAQIYLKLMIDGISSPPFSATTLPPIPQAAHSFVPEVIEASRKQFAHRRTEVEQDVVNWMQPINPPKTAPRIAAAPSSGSSSQASSQSRPALTSQLVQSQSNSQSQPQSQPQRSYQNQSNQLTQPSQPNQHGQSHHQSTQTQPQTQAPRQPKAASPGLGDLLKKVIPAKEAVKEVKPEHKPEAKIEPKPEVKTEAKSEIKKEEKPVSLSSLSPKPAHTPAKNDQKTATPKNVNDLKAALAAAMKKPEAKTEVKTEAKKEEKPAPASTTSAPTPAEVPQDVLENILKID